MKTQTIKELEQLIKSANEAYRSGEPVMDDKEYDILVEQLTDIDPENELVKKSVLEEQPISRKKKLPIPMYSLNKKKSIQEIQDWVKSKGIPNDAVLVITPKYDGISLCVDEYKTLAFTRGDGEYGQQSTHHYRKMNGSGNYTDSITFGEAIISKKNWEKYFKGQINPQTKKPYSNARNTVAGLLGRDIVVDDLKHVDYVRYGLGSNEGGLNKVNQLQLLSPNEEMPNVVYETILVSDLSNPKSLKIVLDDLYKEWSEFYQIDGLVIDVNDPSLRKQLGREENMNPAYSIAYKNPDWSGSVEVTVDRIAWEISKNGKLKPVIEIEPVEFGGVTISNVTGYNAKYIIDNNICPEAVIEITRSGDVIPKHLKTILYSEGLFEELMDCMVVCPCCFEPVKWDESFTELVCTNPECEEMRVNKIVHFFSTVGVEEFGKPSIKSLYDYGFNSVEKILSMEEKDFENIPGWGKKSTKIVLNEFKKLEGNIPFARLLHALDLFEGKIGEKTCQSILDNSVEDITMFLSLDCPDNLPDWGVIEKLKLIDGVSDITAECFCLGMINFNSKTSFGFDWTTYASYFESPKKEVTSSKYEGFSVCMSGFRDKEMEERIQQGGGKIASGVSKTTTHLILKDLSSTSSKTEKAKKEGVKILSIDQFNAL